MFLTGDFTFFLCNWPKLVWLNSLYSWLMHRAEPCFRDRFFYFCHRILCFLFASTFSEVIIFLEFCCKGQHVKHIRSIGRKFLGPLLQFLMWAYRNGTVAILCSVIPKMSWYAAYILTMASINSKTIRIGTISCIALIKHVE